MSEAVAIGPIHGDGAPVAGLREAYFSEWTGDEVSDFRQRAAMLPRMLRTASAPPDVWISVPASHVEIDPAILYLGTPVVLLSTVDGEGRPNLAPMSSVFWLGHTAVLGMGMRSQTASNLLATGEVVINLPSVAQVTAVDRLSLTTGRDPVPADKAQVGYRHAADKFALAGATAVPSATIAPPRVAECPVSLEGRVVATHPLHARDPAEAGSASVFEVAINRVHVHPDVQDAAYPNRIDPHRWRPLIMSFQKYFGLTDQIHPSRLATIDEEWYR